MAVGEAAICEGFAGGTPGTYWSALPVPEFVKTGVRTGDEFSVPGAELDPGLCDPMHCALPAMDGSLQSTPSEGVLCDNGSLSACEKPMPVERMMSTARESVLRVSRDSRIESIGISATLACFLEPNNHSRVQLPPRFAKRL